jgi:broad specificity phosphatase PhoE
MDAIRDFQTWWRDMVSFLYFVYSACPVEIRWAIAALILIGILFRWARISSVKTIYFVRHGESKLNALKIRQGEEGGLSEKGIRQVEAQAERLLNIGADIVLTSHFERAEETAAIIAKRLHKNICTIKLLAERRNPKEIIGKDATDPEVLKIVDYIDKSFHAENVRYSDEENFEDLKIRAKELLKYLSKRRESTIVAVTHGIFLKMVASYINCGEALTANQYAMLSFANDADNAGVTMCRYDPYVSLGAVKGWSLVIWNEIK